MATMLGAVGITTHPVSSRTAAVKTETIGFFAMGLPRFACCSSDHYGLPAATGARRSVAFQPRTRTAPQRARSPHAAIPSGRPGGLANNLCGCRRDDDGLLAEIPMYEAVDA